MSKIVYKPAGVCSREMSVEAEDGVIKSVHISGGCGGNQEALSKLLVGMPVKDAIRSIDGIKCGKRQTSCPDQLARALEQFPE